MQKLKPLAKLYSCAGRFESYLVANAEDRFSRDEANCLSACLFVQLLIVLFRIARGSSAGEKAVLKAVLVVHPKCHCSSAFCLSSTFEPPHDKMNYKMTVRPLKTQISLDICPV